MGFTTAHHRPERGRNPKPRASHTAQPWDAMPGADETLLLGMAGLAVVRVTDLASPLRITRIRGTCGPMVVGGVAAYPPYMPKVFVSHATGDQGLVESEILPVLRDAGVDVWWAHGDIRAGEAWEREIHEALRTTDIFVLVMSPQSARSAWVKAELGFAMERLADRIIPLLVETCESFDFHLQLHRLQHLDYRSPDAARRQQLKDSLLARAAAAKPLAQPTAGEPLKPPTSPFHCGPWVPPEFFIGRRRDLDAARELVRTGQSFLIVGHPRAGKTSFCRKLKDEITNTDASVLAGYINLQQFSELSLATFLEHTVLSIIGEMARKLFGVRYSDLRVGPSAARDELMQDHNYRSFQEMFRLVRARTHVGLNPNASGAVPLDRHDFEQFCRDLLEIAADKGKRTFVMLYDEANRIFLDEVQDGRERLSAGLLESIAEALTDSGLLGGYVASPEMVKEFRRLAIFGAELPLGPFVDIDEMRHLLARYYFDDPRRITDLPIAQAALAELWDTSRGEPFLIQIIADRSFRLAISDRAGAVDSRHVRRARDEVRHERPNAFVKN